MTRVAKYASHSIRMKIQKLASKKREVNNALANVLNNIAQFQPI